MLRKLIGIIIVSLGATFFAVAADADDGETYIKYEECREKERADIYNKTFNFEGLGGLTLWQGSSIPFVCNGERGLEKATYEVQLTNLLDRVLFIPVRAISDEPPKVEYSICKLFTARRASKALKRVDVPSHLRIQSIIVKEITGGENFFLECFAGVDPYARAFSAQ